MTNGKIDLATRWSYKFRAFFSWVMAMYVVLLAVATEEGPAPSPWRQRMATEDGIAGLAVTGEFRNNVQINLLLGKADRTFGPPIPFRTGL
jgi:hypothetical protein